MKLIGSLTEDRLREELENSRRALVEYKRCREILLAIGLTDSSKDQIAALEQFPDTECEYLSLLLPNKNIVRLDVPDFTSEPIVVAETPTLDQYRSGLSRNGHIRLTVALQIASSKDELST